MTQRQGKRGDRVWQVLRRAILAESDICWLCGKPGADTVDHVVPVSVAPWLELEPSNLRPAHGRKRPGCIGNYGRGNGSRVSSKSREW